MRSAGGRSRGDGNGLKHEGEKGDMLADHNSDQPGPQREYAGPRDSGLGRSFTGRCEDKA